MEKFYKETSFFKSSFTRGIKGLSNRLKFSTFHETAREFQISLSTERVQIRESRYRGKDRGSSVGFKRSCTRLPLETAIKKRDSQKRRSYVLFRCANGRA